jgi:tripartite-type tricarboxylate transporter receptor subunit TctC
MRRRVAGLGTMILALSLTWPAVGSAQAQAFPTKPVRIIAPFGAGGAVGFLITFIAQKLEAKWGERVLIDPRPGAAGNLGADAVARSEPDGYTLLFTTQAIAVNVSLNPGVAVRPLQALAPIAYVAAGDMVLLVPDSLPVKSLAEFVAYAKARPGELNFASLGTGSMSQLAAELFNGIAGIEMAEIPYNGPGPATMDLMAGRTTYWMTNIPNIQPGGKTRALAVSGSRRASQLPDVPTFAEQGYGEFEASAWFALYAPAGTPKARIDLINRDVNDVLAMPDVKERFVTASMSAPGGTPEDLARHVQSEIDRWAKVIGAQSRKPEAGK